MTDEQRDAWLRQATRDMRFIVAMCVGGCILIVIVFAALVMP